MISVSSIHDSEHVPLWENTDGQWPTVDSMFYPDYSPGYSFLASPEKITQEFQQDALLLGYVEFIHNENDPALVLKEALWSIQSIPQLTD